MLQYGRVMTNQPTRPRPRLLIAEDDDEMRRLLQIALRRDGYDVVALDSGSALLERLLERDDANLGVDLVVSDVRMPGLLGTDVLAVLRARGFTVPVILITAFCEDSLANEAARLGATALFSKPFDLDDLRTAVRCFLYRPTLPI